jgi:ABC-2 type transport system permease protein
MGKLGVVFRREYLERVRSRWFLLGTLLGPAFFLLIVLAPRLLGDRNRGTSDLAHVDVLDVTGTGLGARVATALHDSYPLSRAPYVREIDESALGVAEDRAVLRVQRNEVIGYLVLDSGTVAGHSMRYAGRNAGSRNDVDALRGVVRQQVLVDRMEQEGIDAGKVAAFSRIRLEIHTQPIGDKGRETGNGIGQIMFGYAVALLLYMMIVIYGQTIMRGVMEEKTTRVAEVVVSSVDTDTLLAGKILGVGLVAITQVLSWVAISVAVLYYAGPMLFGKDGGGSQVAAAGAVAQSAASRGAPGMDVLGPGFPTIPLWAALALLCCFVFGFIFYSSLFAAVGAMVNSQEDVQQAATPVMLLLVSSVVFMGPIMANPGSSLARTMSLIPTSAPILMPLRMTLVPVPWYEVLGALLGVLLASLGAIWLSARIYRVGLLMYGKKPSFGELARWIRYAR